MPILLRCPICHGLRQIGVAVSSPSEKIGLSEVTLDTEGSSGDTQVTIGGNIAPGLRLQYGAGVFNSIAEVKVRYELLPRLYVQAVSGLTQAICSTSSELRRAKSNLAVTQYPDCAGSRRKCRGSQLCRCL